MGLLNIKSKSFTLLEATVALALITLFLVLPMSNYTKFDSDLKKATFFKEFRSAWNYSLVQSKIRNTIITFKFDTARQEIEYYDRGNHSDIHHLNVPRGLKLNSNPEISISRNGTVKPFTVAFTDLDQKKNINYKVQMEWGELIHGK